MQNAKGKEQNEGKDFFKIFEINELFAMNKLSHSTYLVRLRVTQSQGLWLSLSILKLFSYPLHKSGYSAVW